MTKRSTRLLAAGAAIALVGGAGVAIAGATGGDDDAAEKAITGSALDRASAAALAHVGSGRVTGTEAGDEEGAYEVEITRPDGGQVDVHLDRSFEVLGTEADGDDGED